MKKFFNRWALEILMTVGLIVIVVGVAFQRQIMIGVGAGITAAGVVAYLNSISRQVDDLEDKS